MPARRPEPQAESVPSLVGLPDGCNALNRHCGQTAGVAGAPSSRISPFRDIHSRQSRIQPEMAPEIHAQAIAVRLVLTILAGGTLGLERSRTGHSAGLRTTLLVTLAASVAMIQMNLLM